MHRRSLLSAAALCACATLGVTRSLAATTDVVLYATDAANLRGNWSRIADASAAGGQLLASADYGWSNTGGPAVSPANSVDFTFSAPSATAYHVWLRMRAANHSKFNDSVYLPFSDAVDAAGAAVFAIGTRSGVTVNLAPDNSNSGLAGWGWQDGAYWLTQPKTVRFATTGSHTLRIQTREDGVQIDQVVLSPATYLTSAPGQRSNDATIVPKPVSAPPP